MRISTDKFSTCKDLYKDIFEVFSQQLTLVAGINNLLKRQDHNSFSRGSSNRNTQEDQKPTNLNKFAEMTFGQKQKFIDDSWHQIQKNIVDNKLRNAISHYEATYDDLNQKITYSLRNKGLNATSEETISFLNFVRQILIAYREMHRLHHPIQQSFAIVDSFSYCTSTVLFLSKV